MGKHWNKTIIGVAIGLFLVGCSILTVQHPANFEAVPSLPVAGLTPGVSRVTVARIGASQATLRWQSPWQGQTVVYYATTPLVLPLLVDKTPGTVEPTTTLDNLRPATRYFFQIETHTPLGTARSAVLSFLTAAPAPPPDEVVHMAFARHSPPAAAVHMAFARHLPRPRHLRRRTWARVAYARRWRRR